MDRRLLIKLAGLSLASFAGSLAWPKRLRADALFETVFGDARQAAKVGLAHRKVDAMAGERGLVLVADLAALPRSAREKQLRANALADLKKLDIVVADGWVMARSEADLCAAVHLDRGEAT